MKKEITILLCNHFDLTWRRCFERSIYYEGRQWISYGEIEKFYIKRCLMMCEQDENFCFNIESITVLRRFLEVCPEEEKRIKAYIKKGRIDVPFTGDNIVDGNLIQGESLIRNYLYGSRYMKERFGHESKSAYRRDAFGNSAQIPQILKQFGIDWVWGISYTLPEGTVWQGLDGTTICCMEPPFFAESGSIDKYAPCTACEGSGETEGNMCPVCEGKGINWKDKKFDIQIPEVEQTEEYSVWGQRSEELIPPFEMLQWPQKMENIVGEDTKIKFGTFADIHSRMEESIRQQLEEGTICGSELNPNNSGVYVTRNRLKKVCRECENRMSDLEHMLSVTVRKGIRLPYAKVEKIWHKMLFLMFHDAVTGTVVDAAYEELMDIADEIRQETEKLFVKTTAYLTEKKKQCYTILNPSLVSVEGMLEVELPAHIGQCDLVTETGEKLLRTEWKKKENNKMTAALFVPKINPMECLNVFCEAENKRIPIEEPNSPGEIENDRYRICLDDKGIVSIFDKNTGWKLEEKNGVRVHEILLECDEGSPWTTLGRQSNEEKLTPKTRWITTEKTEVFERAFFKVAPFNSNTVEGVELVWSVTLVKNSSRIDFKTDVEYWDTYNQRIRVIFPTDIQGRHLYEIPYGVLERKPYYTETGKWDAASGDWPAVHWAGISTETKSIAVLNFGIPSYGVKEDKEGDILSISLLRSPCIPTYLHEPRSYSMRGFDGMRDSGSHQFSYSLSCYEGALKDSSVVEDGEAFQVKLRMLPGKMEQQNAPAIKSKNIRLAAYYPDQDGCLYVRLAEYRGDAGTALVKVPGVKRIVQCLLNGQPVGGETAGDEISIAMGPYEIATLRCEV